MADTHHSNPSEGLPDRTELILEYLRARESSTKETKPTWLKVLESAGFVALVTVIIGGLVGSAVTYLFQMLSKEREQSAAATVSEKQRELADFRQHLERERTVIDTMSQELGVYIDASEDLATLSRSEWNTPKRREQRKEIVKKFNRAETEWSSDRIRLSLLLQLEHDNDPNLLSYFKAISQKADAYARCADRWRTRYIDLSADEARKACGDFRSSLDGAIFDFSGRLVTLRMRSVTASMVAINNRSR
jgi:hypothetical protein